MTIRYSPSTKGFYSNNIDYGEGLPADVIEIGDDQHAALLAAQAAGHVIMPSTEGAPVAIDPRSLWTLDEIKAVKLAELSAAFSDRMSVVKAGYPLDEIQSWFDQKSEAVAYTADKTAWTPLLSAMAAARGIAVADLASRVIANSVNYSAAAGALIGKRQKYEDAVNAAADAAAVSAIVWTD
jgi:hypothetical protein